jgi:hypothetical protein
VGKKSNASFDEVPMFALGNAVLLGRVRTGNTMMNTLTSEIARKGAIFSPPPNLTGRFGFLYQEDVLHGFEIKKKHVEHRTFVSIDITM